MTDFLTIVPNLSIGVIAVIALAYISLNHARTQKENQKIFLDTLEQRADKHDKAMNERWGAMRELEASVRASLTEQLTRNTIALSEAAKVLSRVVNHLDGECK